MPSTHFLGKAADHGSKVTAQGLGNRQHPSAPFVQFMPEGVHGAGPRDRRELAGTSGSAALHGTGDPVRMVQSLEAGVAPGALLPQVNGVEGVALDLLSPAFHHPNQDALSGWAIAAEGRVPVIGPLYQVFGQHCRALNIQFPVTDSKPFTGYRPNG